jgi:hypothetical protein
MKGFSGGFLGGMAFFIIVITICIFCHNHNAIVHPIHPVYLGNLEVVDSITVSMPDIQTKLEEIQKLKDQGILLSPQEYTNNVISYYNTIITFLVALLAIFSLVTFFHLKFITVEEVKKTTTELLRNSPEIQKVLIENFKGKIDDVLIEYKTRISKIEDILKDEHASYEDVEDESEIGDTECINKLKVKK